MDRQCWIRFVAASAVVPTLLLAGCDESNEDKNSRSPRDGDAIAAAPDPVAAPMLGVEVGLPRHLEDGEEFEIPLHRLLAHGRRVFEAAWTPQEGGGRPLTDGVGSPLVDPANPLLFPRNFNRVSAPDSNACAGCHNKPFVGGGGEIVTNAFVTGQRFDFATFDPFDDVPTRGAVDELGNPVTLQEIANERSTSSLFGAGYVEMLSREITVDLQAIRDGLQPGQSAPLTSKGISFGTLTRNADGSYDVSAVEGLGALSLDPSLPSLVIRPFHASGVVVSLREFSNNAMNHHHGMQSAERFGFDADPDGDGFVDELTAADITAVSLFQAVLPVPGRVIPRVPAIEAAVATGEALFEEIGCASCHVPALPLSVEGSRFSEPGPFNPSGNLVEGDVPTYELDLNDPSLPGARLAAGDDGVTWVPTFSDFKLHDITDGPDDPNADPVDMHAPAGSEASLQGTTRFLSKRLWGAASEAPMFHHGKFITFRQAIEQHRGEANLARGNFDALGEYEQAAVIEFLKTLRLLPATVKSPVVDERMRPRTWSSDYVP